MVAPVAGFIDEPVKIAPIDGATQPLAKTLVKEIKAKTSEEGAFEPLFSAFFT